MCIIGMICIGVVGLSGVVYFLVVFVISPTTHSIVVLILLVIQVVDLLFGLLSVGLMLCQYSNPPQKTYTHREERRTLIMN